jgi:23S rRNA pseudouridine2604 synthase
MATLKLNKKPAAAGAAKPSGEKRAPLRGKGVSRPRQTLEQAQTERREKQAAFEERRRHEEIVSRERPPARKTTA